MEPRTKRLIGVFATLLLAAASLSSRMKKGELRSRSLLVLDPQTVVEKQINYPEQVRPWDQDVITPRSLSKTSETSGLESEDAPRTNLRSIFPLDMENAEPGLQRDESTASGVLRESSEILIPEKPRTTFNLPLSSEEWCAPPDVPPLPYTNCKDTVSVNQLPLYGGLTNSLKMLLLGAILSFEQNRCFYVDESVSALPKRSDPANAFSTSFLDRYFEPIGIPEHDAMVESARYNENLKVIDWRESWDWTHNRRIAGQSHDIESLDYTNMDGHRLKRIMLKRMWRPLPAVRQQTCSQLEKHVGPEEFMAFSVRRGDKATENFQFATADQYIEAAEKATISRFGGVVPTIFVASDDCSIMDEFRSKRPSWRFVSECDHAKQDGGFDLQEMKDWSHGDTDVHFNKFFVELYAMASAKYFIGVIYTNVTWWALFMRAQDPSTFEILFTPGTEKREGIAFW